MKRTGIMRSAMGVLLGVGLLAGASVPLRAQSSWDPVEAAKPAAPAAATTSAPAAGTKPVEAPKK